MTIKRVYANEILDSRGNPTVKAYVELDDGTVGSFTCPSGASTGTYEAVELRDGDKNRYGGKGVLKAVQNVNNAVNEALQGKSVDNIYLIDGILRELDGTDNKSNLGANCTLAVSMAAAVAGAKSHGEPLYRFLGGATGCTLPMPMFNILNGGAHSCNSLDVQEFMIVPVGASSFSQCLQMTAEVYHALKANLKQKNLSTAVGDEGGFAPNLDSDEAAIKCLIDGIKSAGYKAGSDFAIALDIASSEWASDKAGEYVMPKCGKKFTSTELIEHYAYLCEKYPIISIEDGLGENDIDGWKNLTQKLGFVQLVGDDFFVTNTSRIKAGIDGHYANAVLIKPNQIGTLSETLQAVLLANSGGYNAIISHRSGETEDTFIADLAVATNVGQIKCGAPCRSERVAKYNRLLEIERELGVGARFYKNYR